MASNNVNGAGAREDDVYDVIVVGAGNAGFSAASTAAQTLHALYSASDSSGTHTPRVLLLEKAPKSSSGGNTFYTAGAYRFSFNDFSDLRSILSYQGQRGIPDSLASKIEMAPYTESAFLADLNRVTSNRADPELANVLVSRSREAVDWMAEQGGQWELSFHRQAYEVDGKFKFWGGLVVCFAGGGKGLVEWHEKLAEREGVEVRHDSGIIDLIVDNVGDNNNISASPPKVIGVEVQHSTSPHSQRILSRGGVILATGGFQANKDLRTRWLGQTWSSAHVRGSATNTGDGHTMTLLSPDRRVRAKRAGHYEGCHSTCWDASSPANGGDRVLTNQYTKSGYPLGIMVNASGKRFVDEGADLRNYTYAIFGREVLKQPGGVAWQIWDADGRAMLRKEEYDASVTDLIVAESLDGLAQKLGSSGLQDRDTFVRTVHEFNDACTAFAKERPDVRFDPASRDGLSTQSMHAGLTLPKSNWARPLLTPPFTAVKITCGVTFTFGGLAVVPDTAQVVADGDGDGGRDTDRTDERRPIEGLYCCGELMGGLFWDNYPGGSGLTAGTVFGRIAGKHAAERAVRLE